MAALLGYLVALAVFLGSGYVGLEWLTSPDVGTHAQSHKKSLAHAPNVASNKPAFVAGGKEADAGTKSDITTGSSGKPVADLAGATDEVSKDPKPDGVPAGGCMPIGVTASGQVVFPLQCRELIQRHHGPASRPASVDVGAPAPALQDTGTHKTGNTDVATSSPKQSEPSSATVADKVAEESNKAKGLDSSMSVADRKDREQVTAAPTNEIEPKNVLPIPPKSNAPRSAIAKPKRLEKMRPSQAPSRLVAMTLETLRFEDGHLERRLVPKKPPARTAMQTDWYNPLGLR